MKNIPRIQKHFLKFDAWLKDSTRGLQDGIIWEPIEEVANIFLHEVQVITTENNHNFIANGFLVHNCGPCTMMAPVFEKASKNYQGRLKFAKVSTENEPDLAEQYQIRSIPCLKIFSKGEEIAEFIGFQSEASLKRQIDEVLNRL